LDIFLVEVIIRLKTFRYAEERQDNQEEEDYYSPSDIYRAVLRNNAAKTAHDGKNKFNFKSQKKKKLKQINKSNKSIEFPAEDRDR
jgi:hypothetical protein